MRIRHEHEWRGAGQRHGGKILGRIERSRLAIKDRGDRERGLGTHHECVSVGRRLRHVGCCDHATRPGAVLNDDRLAEAVGHFRREDAGDDVGAAAGAEADEKLDRPVGIACHLRSDGAGRAGQRERESQSGAQRSRCLHRSPLATRYDRVPRCPRFILAGIPRMNPNFEVHGNLKTAKLSVCKFRLTFSPSPTR